MKYRTYFDSLLKMSKNEQIDEILKLLPQMGFKKVKMNQSKAYCVCAYVKAHNDYVIVEMTSKNDDLKTSLCIMDYEDFEKLRHMYFCNSLRGKKGCKSYARIQVFGMYEGKHLSGVNVCEMVCAKTKGQVIDHKFHNTMINTREALRACTVKENNMNNKKCKNPANSKYAYKVEEDFSKTWFVYVYWRVLGLISQNDAFTYNRMVN